MSYIAIQQILSRLASDEGTFNQSLIVKQFIFVFL